MLYGEIKIILKQESWKSLNPYFFGKCSTATSQGCGEVKRSYVLILIFLENALRLYLKKQIEAIEIDVLILIFLENALRPYGYRDSWWNRSCLNPYFFGKCSTASKDTYIVSLNVPSLNPYFFGKCSTAATKSELTPTMSGLNPYFFGKCSTALQKKKLSIAKNVMS